ncbi:hypothetical protein [Burkholderia gladioli]|uniref:hypothetical protein n=1 Tax=Burkholderia gladioli TaxID=28095 RepID=UPI00163FE7F8|nr:hypothetical protein [Burkholderia gladioli]
MTSAPFRRLLAALTCAGALLPAGIVLGSTPPAGYASAPRAIDFVVAVASRDLAQARADRRHGLNYADDETEARLAAAIREWLTDGNDVSLHLAPADRMSLFALYWSAQQMPANSNCFQDPDDDGCAQELAQWMGAVRDDAPAFLAAYHRAERSLNLPSLPAPANRLQTGSP